MRDWPQRWEALIRSVTRVHGDYGQQQLIEWLAHPPGPRVLGFANAHAMNSAASDEAFFKDLHAVDILLRDGSGMALLMTLLNQEPGLNLNGTDLIPRLLRRFAGQPIALFGTQDPWLGRARRVIESGLAPGSDCVVADGFLPQAAYLELAERHRPRLIILAMGMPRQEQLAQALRARISWSCLIVCGGAVLDFLAGRVVRAPQALRRLGLEWAWRLAHEPRRLFRRYVVGNPVFMMRATWLALRRWREAAAA